MSTIVNDERESSGSRTADEAAVRLAQQIQELRLPDKLFDFIDPSGIYNNPIPEATDGQRNGYVLGKLIDWQSRSGQDVDYSLLGDFQEDFEGWNEEDFRSLQQDLRRPLKDHLIRHGICLGSWNGPTNVKLAEVVICDDLPTWTDEALRQYGPRLLETTEAYELWQEWKGKGTSKDPQRGPRTPSPRTPAEAPRYQTPSGPNAVQDHMAAFEGNLASFKRAMTVQREHNPQLARQPPSPYQSRTVSNELENPRKSTPALAFQTPERHREATQATEGRPHLFERRTRSPMPPSRHGPVDQTLQHRQAPLETEDVDPYRQIPPRQKPNEMLPATVLAQFAKLWRKEMNYTGEVYNLLDEKVRYFLNTCANIGIRESQFHAAFNYILDGAALDFYSYQMSPRMTFAEMYWALHHHFETEVNREHYHSDWTTVTFLSMKALNPTGTNLEVLDQLLSKLKKCQRALGASFMAEDQLVSATIRACRGVQEFEFALYAPAQTFEQLRSQLRSSVITSESRGHRGAAQFQGSAYLADRNFHRPSSRPRTGPAPSPRRPAGDTQWKAKCFICSKPSCWSSNHTPEERERSKREWKRAKEFRREQGTFASFLAEYEGESEDDYDDEEDPERDRPGYGPEAHFTEVEDPEAFLRDHSEEAKTAQGLIQAAAYHRIATSYDGIIYESVDQSVEGATMFSADRYSDRTYQGQMPDTGASMISTVGIGQARALIRICPWLSIDQSKSDGNTVRFGDGPRTSCLGTLTVEGPLGTITYFVTEGNTPFLFCLKDMDDKGIYFDNTRDELVNKLTGARVPVTRKFGHGWFHTNVASDASSHFTEGELRRLHRRFGHPSVGKLEALLTQAGHEVDRDALQLIRRFCHYCQVKGPSGQRFKFTLQREADFNYEIIVDVMYLEGKPTLHIVDAGTNFQAARFLRSISAKETWEALKECWMDTYLGPPDVVSHDAGTNFNSDEFRTEARLAGITVNQVPVEAHWSIGKVERYHAPLRRAYEIIRAETARSDVSEAACLQMAVKAVNDSSGPDGLVPTLLVFGAYPRISKDSPPTASQQQRAAAAAKAMAALRKMRAARDVQNALRARNGPDTEPTLPKSLPLGSEVLVYREKEKWTGPYKVLAVSDTVVTVELDNGPAPFRSTAVKPYNRDPEYLERTIEVAQEDPLLGPGRSLIEAEPFEYPERQKKRPRGRPRKNPIANAQETNEDHLIESFVTHKEKADYELALSLRREGKITTPGRAFEGSDAAEIDALFGSGVLVAVHRDEVTEKAQIFGSRMVREVKGRTSLPYEKSRLVVCGFNDHEKATILTQAPTVQRASQRIVLALSPSLRQQGKEAMVRDISQAYTQSVTPLNRVVYLRLPHELKEKYPQGTVLKVMKPLYGLAEAGLHWYATYSKHHKEKLAMETSSFDPCLLITRQGEEAFGITAMQTDDTFNVGTKPFLEREETELNAAGFKAKPQTILTDGDSCDFNGMLIQVENGEVTCIQKGQAERLLLVDDKAIDQMQQYVMQRARGAYIASICQPEAAFDYSVAAQVREPDSEDIARLNQRIQWQLENKQRGLRYRAVDLATAKLFVFVDGSFANNRDLTSQIGYVIALGNEAPSEDRARAGPAVRPVDASHDEAFALTGNLIHWSSTKCKRVTRSVLASEVYGMVSGYDLGYVIRDTIGTIMKRLGIAGPPLILCTDSYSLYQCLVQLGTTTEKRLMIDVMALRQSYEDREIQEIRWIKGDDNPADAMTKGKPNGALEEFVTEGRINVRLEGWVQRKEG